MRTRELMCINKVNMKEVDASECVGLVMPKQEQACSKEPCSQQWETSGWMECSTTCGQGMSGRDVTCSEEDQCDPHTKPKEKRSCSMSACNMWVAGIWDKVGSSTYLTLQQQHL